jgi:proteasome accessory factor B
VSPEVPTSLRVLSLFFDLLTSERGRTKDQVRRSPGYEELSPSAFESAFQRDKDSLREAGIVLELVPGPAQERYRVAAESFPEEGAHLSAVDLALVDLAVSAWSSVPAAGAQMLRSKLASRAERGPDGALVPVVLGLDGSQRLVDVLDAIRARQPIAFTYAASSGTGERSVEPWRLVLRGSGLYLQGLDLDREAPRMFRLSRIRGEVERLGEPGDAPPPAEDPGDPFEALTVSPVLRVRPGGAPRVRLHTVASGNEGPSDGGAPADRSTSGAGWETVRGLPDEIGGWISRILREAPDVVVVEPEDLRREILDRLRAAAQWEPQTRRGRHA